MSRATIYGVLACLRTRGGRSAALCKRDSFTHYRSAWDRMISPPEPFPEAVRDNRLIMEPDFNRLADEMICAGSYAKARTLLEAALREIPVGWSPRNEDDRSLRIAFWDEEEFFAYCDRQGDSSEQLVLWIKGSYSKAWYQLAIIASEQEEFERALFCLDCGLELEPDHPELWSEKGYLLGRIERQQEALDCYVRAGSVRDWASSSQLARSLRGQGVQLIDLNHLDDAENAIRKSLELEPNSEVARKELEYIENLRRQRDAGSERDLPWFVRSLVIPPADPLTIHLLALVEGLPSIPGPQTVGSENYSSIFDKFMQHGWEGFEEEFDRIVPRERPDYADVKRDLLCEPIFNPKAHRKLTEAVFGAETSEEILGGLARKRKQILQ